MSLEPLLFTLSASFALGGAIVVAIETRIFRAVMGLLLSLAGVAGIFAVLGAPLLAALQVILYAGGVVVLFLFAVFVTPVAEGGRMRSSAWAIAFSLLAAAATGGVLLATVAWRSWGTSVAGQGVEAAHVGQAFLGEYLLPFEAISILLLAALVAAVHLVRKEAQA